MDLVVGRVVKAHGITGEVVVDVRTDDPDDAVRAGHDAARQGAGTRAERDFVVDVDARARRPAAGPARPASADRDAADALRGTLFIVDTADLPPIDDPDEFYDHQLEGLRVRTVAGGDVGVVAEVLHTAAGELLSVRPPTGTGPRCWCRSSARS